MYNKVVLFFFVFVFQFKGNTQTTSDSLSILIYSEGKGYLQPFINNKIENLTNQETGKPYFMSVNSFNQFISDNKYQAELSNLIGTQKPENTELNPYYSNSEKEVRKRIFSILKGYKYFLIVKTNTLGELIEFQFQLFQTITSNNNVPYNISDKIIASENFFVNPKEPSYQSDIENAIKRLFINSNKVPEAELMIFGKVFKSNSQISFPLNTVIIIDGSNSGDYDSENISYIWRNVPYENEKYQTINKIPFNHNSPTQKVNLSRKGNYRIGFKVFDGIQYSNEIIIEIKTKKKIRSIIINDSIYTSRQYFSLFSKKKEISFKSDLCTAIKDSVSNKLILLKKSFAKKFIQNLDKELINKTFKVNTTDTKLGTHKLDTLAIDDQKHIHLEFETLFNSLENKTIREQEMPYYLYYLDDDGLLVNEKKIIHKLLSRGALSLQVLYNTYMITFQGNSETGFFPSVSLGIFITNYLELNFSVPISTSESLTNEAHRFTYPNNIQYSIKYQFLKHLLKQEECKNRFDTFFSLGLKSYSLTTDDENKSTQLYNFSQGFGVNYNLTSWKALDLGFRLEMANTKIRNEKFKGANIFEMSIGFYTRF